MGRAVFAWQRRWWQPRLSATLRGMTLQEILISEFFGCSPDVARRAAALFDRRMMARGQTLFRQGDECANCWLIIEGTASLRTISFDGQLVQLASYGPGEFAGAYPTRRRQDAELVADGRIEALEADAAALACIAQVEPGLGSGIAALFARQHQQLVARLANRMTLSAVARVYAELLALASDSGLIAPAPVLAALALRVNTTRETASRAVAAAERRGLLRRDPQGLRIVSRARLLDLVC